MYCLTFGHFFIAQLKPDVLSEMMMMMLMMMIMMMMMLMMMM